MRTPTPIERVHSGRARVMVAAAAGSAVAFVAAWFVPWQLTVLLWWDTAALLLIGAVWVSVTQFSAEETAEYATQEDDSRTFTQLTLLGSALVSLLGVAAAFVKANQGDRSLEAVLEGAGIFTIACSWAVIHTVFALRYAHLYYSEPRGGIDFKMRADPDYRDFAYTAFTVGMTFQVSDTDITQQLMRRAVLRHALLSFLFGAVILATTVNVIAGLLNS